MISKIIKNISFLTISRIVTQLIALITTIYISRVLGVENYGKIGFVSALFIYFDMFSTMGLETYSIREVSRENSKLPYFVKDTIAIRFLTSIFLFIIILFLQLFVIKKAYIAILLVTYGLNLFVKSFSINWAFIALDKIKYYGVTSIILQSIYLIFIYGYVKEPNDFFYVPYCLLAGNIGAVIFTWVLNKNKITEIGIVFDINKWIKIIKISFPMVLSFLLIKIYLNINLVILGFIGNEFDVGLFAASIKFLFFLISFREILTTISYPQMSKYFLESKKRLKSVMDMFLRISIMFALPVSIGGIILAKEIIEFTFGAEFSEASTPFSVLLIGFLIMMINIVYPGSQNAFNKQNIYLKITITLSVLAVLFNIVGIYYFGLIGAAIATVLTELFSLIFFKRESNKTINVEFIKTLIKTFPPVLLMIIVIYLFNEQIFIIKFVLAIIAYLIGLVLFKTVTVEEVKSLKSLI